MAGSCIREKRINSANPIAFVVSALAFSAMLGAQNRATDVPGDTDPSQAGQPVETAASKAQDTVRYFFENSIKTAYITPRGLVVHTDGLAIQPLAGLILDIPSGDSGRTISLTTGVWSDAHLTHDDLPLWNEIDYFAGISTNVNKRFDLSATYIVFTSPPHNFKPEHNLEFKFAYKDNNDRCLSLQPYAKVFYAIAGDSTVALGRKGSTFDVETGVGPWFKASLVEKLPIVFSLPTFVTIGGPGFFGDGGRLGVVSTGVLTSLPLKLISTQRVNWTLEGGASYFRLLDDNLVRASRLLGNGGQRDRRLTQIRIGVGF